MAMNGGRVIVGDLGVRGGLASVHATDDIGLLSDAIDIPTVGSGAAECVDVSAVRDWVQLHHPALALIERAQAMPRQGASSGFKYGRAVRDRRHLSSPTASAHRPHLPT